MNKGEAKKLLAEFYCFVFWLTNDSGIGMFIYYGVVIV